MSAKKDLPFTKIQQRLYECTHFDLIEINLIARIASWQREGRTFFESKQVTAKLFKTTRPTLDTRFENLISLGIIKKGKKRGRASEYKINEDNLGKFLTWSINNPEFNICKATLHKVPTFVKPLYIDCKATLHYKNNNKTILNKNSFIDGEEDLASSPSIGPERTPEEELEMVNSLLNEIDLTDI